MIAVLRFSYQTNLSFAFPPPKSLLILSKTLLRGSCSFGLLPFNDPCVITWTISQSLLEFDLIFFNHLLIRSFTSLRYSSKSFGKKEHEFVAMTVFKRLYIQAEIQAVVYFAESSLRSRKHWSTLTKTLKRLYSFYFRFVYTAWVQTSTSHYDLPINVNPNFNVMHSFNSALRLQ